MREKIRESYGAREPRFPGPLPRCTWIAASFWFFRGHFLFGFLMLSERKRFRRKGRREEKKEDRRNKHGLLEAGGAFVR